MNAFKSVADYCRKAEMRLSTDPHEGYWLHWDGRMMFIRSLSDVRGWVDYIERGDLT